MLSTEFLKELLYCVRCGKCRSICPELILEDFDESSSPRGRLRMAYGVISGVLAPTQSLIDKIYSCFYCGLCQETCPSGVNTSDLIIRFRNELFKIGVIPEKIKNLINTILEYKNIYGIDQEDRLEWAFNVEDIIENKIQKVSDLGIFIGCSASFKGSLAVQPESLVEILDYLKIDFTLLGEDEMCCGNPYFLGGGSLNNEIKEIIFNNIEKFANLKIKKLITSCPGCYRVIKNIYPLIYGKKLPFEVYHITQFFSDLIKEKKLRLKNKISLKLTFQDPCELVRHCNIIEEPRIIINNIPGLKFVELYPNKREALCCGGGGLVKAVFKNLVDKHLEIKFNQIKTIENLDGIITTCPSCQDNLEYGAKIYYKELKVFDLCELIKKSLI